MYLIVQQVKENTKLFFCVDFVNYNLRITTKSQWEKTTASAFIILKWLNIVSDDSKQSKINPHSEWAQGRMC